MPLLRAPVDYSVLIADDHAASRDSLREIVAQVGFRPVVAESGEAALDILQADQVHLLLCDMQMPRLTGIETVQIAHRINADLPCILLSAEPSERLIRQALEVRAFSFIAKPVRKHELVYTMSRALHRTYEAPAAN